MAVTANSLISLVLGKDLVCAKIKTIFQLEKLSFSKITFSVFLIDKASKQNKTAETLIIYLVSTIFWNQTRFPTKMFRCGLAMVQNVRRGQYTFTHVLSFYHVAQCTSKQRPWESHSALEISET